VRMDDETRAQAISGLLVLSWAMREMVRRERAAKQVTPPEMVCEPPATYGVEKVVRWRYHRPGVLKRLCRALDWKD
jgi:hypothetical protein